MSRQSPSLPYSSPPPPFPPLAWVLVVFSALLVLWVIYEKYISPYFGNGRANPNPNPNIVERRPAQPAARAPPQPQPRRQQPAPALAPQLRQQQPVPAPKRNATVQSNKSIGTLKNYQPRDSVRAKQREIDPSRECGICFGEACQEDSNNRQEWWVLPDCKHMFHATCILKWIASSGKTCPLCRREFFHT
ncbi:hypothetical protein ACHQM5_014668 [Ranunculus cassubicifolius]